MSTTQTDMLKASAEKDVEYNKNNNPYTANGVNYAKAAGMPIAFRHGMKAAVILSFGLQCIL